MQFLLDDGQWFDEEKATKCKQFDIYYTVNNNWVVYDNNDYGYVLVSPEELALYLKDVSENISRDVYSAFVTTEWPESARETVEHVKKIMFPKEKEI